MNEEFVTIDFSEIKCFLIDLTGAAPEAICADCAAKYGLAHESGAQAIWCEHSRAAFVRLRPSRPWRVSVSGAPDFPGVGRVLRRAVAIAKRVAQEQAKGAPRQ